MVLVAAAGSVGSSKGSGQHLRIWGAAGDLGSTRGVGQQQGVWCWLQQQGVQGVAKDLGSTRGFEEQQGIWAAPGRWAAAGGMVVIAAAGIVGSTKEYGQRQGI